MKKIYILLCFLLSAVLLSSCNGKPEMIESRENNNSQEITELVLWTFPVGNWGNPTSVANMLTGFHKEYPNIHISVEYLDYENGDERVNQAVLDGSAPDLILWRPGANRDGWLTYPIYGNPRRPV